MRKTQQWQPEQWRAFRSLRLRALADAPDAFSTTLAQAEAVTEQAWRDRLTTTDPLLGVFEDDVPVAMGGGWVPEGSRSMMIWGMWTAPPARGRGHGRALVETLLEWAQEHQITEVSLHVTQGNGGARHLYERCGFEATGDWEPLRDGSSLQIELMRLRTRACGADEDPAASPSRP